MREKILFNDNWTFHLGDIEKTFPSDKGPVYASAKTEHMLWGPASRHYNGRPDNYVSDAEYCTDSWEHVTLPHDYIICQEPKKNFNNALGFFDYQNAWYRKEFFLSNEDENKRLTLYFEGVATHCTVYLNGCVLKRNFCGYTSFEVDITDFAKFGNDKENKNVLAVYAENKCHEGWWYQGGGIYRHVWLVKTEKVSVDLYGVYVRPERKKDFWQIDFETTVRNDFDSGKEADIVTYVVDNEGNTVAKAACKAFIPYREKSVCKYSAVLENPVLWDIDNPYRYTAVTVVSSMGAQCDKYETKFGFRYFNLDAKKGFFLNGRHVKIKGVCMHQDFGLTGKAVADNVQRYKIELIKEMGANGFRATHYPHSEATMDALDDLGFIVMDETRWFSSSDEAKEQLEILVKRDRNRPSVFFWTLGNEEPHHTTAEGRKICKALKAVVEKLDDTRIITAAVDKPAECTIYDELDAVGINYNLDRYTEARERHSGKTVFASECCATGTTRGWYGDDMASAYLSAYDKDTDKWFLGRERTWKFLNGHDWILGGYQWIAFEHRGEAVWPRVCSASGAVDLFLQKKDAFYQNQSHWIEDKPLIHLLPHWNFEGMEGEKVQVWAYTNCEETELFLNGKSLGRRKLEKYGHGEWTVEYEPGTIRAVGLSGGRVVCEDTKETTGKAEKLNLRLDNKIKDANGRDVAVITCFCTDSEGREVPDASPEVFFSCSKLGKILGTGSSNTDHAPVTETGRKMYAGRITVAVRVGDSAGVLKVYACADNLKRGVISIPLSAAD